MEKQLEASQRNVHHWETVKQNHVSLLNYLSELEKSNGSLMVMDHDSCVKIPFNNLVMIPVQMDANHMIQMSIGNGYFASMTILNAIQVANRRMIYIEDQLQKAELTLNNVQKIMRDVGIINEEGLRFIDIKEHVSNPVGHQFIANSDTSKKSLDNISEIQLPHDDFHRNLLSKIEALELEETKKPKKKVTFADTNVNEKSASVSNEKVQMKTLTDTVMEHDHISPVSEDEISDFIIGKELSQEYFAKRERMIALGSIKDTDQALQEDMDAYSIELPQTSDTISSEIQSYVLESKNVTSYNKKPESCTTPPVMEPEKLNDIKKISKFLERRRLRKED